MKREQRESSHDPKKSGSITNPYLDWRNLATDRNNSRLANSQLNNSRSLDGNSFNNKKYSVDPVSEKLNKIDRLSKIREKARVIEQAVNRKEQLMKFNGAHSVSDKINVNDMLINAIEAKLKVLEDL